MASMQEEYEHLAGLEPQVQGGVLVLSKQAAEVSEEGLWMDEQKVTLPADKMVLLRPLEPISHLFRMKNMVFSRHFRGFSWYFDVF